MEGLRCCYRWYPVGGLVFPVTSDGNPFGITRTEREAALRPACKLKRIGPLPRPSSIIPYPRLLKIGQ
jgi:hypothetical protein